MTLSIRRPRVGKVWERGASVDVVVEQVDDVDRDRASECEISLVGQSAWMRSGRTTTLGKASFTDYEDARLTWKVPDDVPIGDYELRAYVPNAKPAIEATTRVVVAERVRVTRTSASEATATWDVRVVPKDYSVEDGWKLAIDIVPEINENEDASAIVSQAFILAAESGPRTHTKNGIRVLCDISNAERESQTKILKLLPNRACSIGLCAFGDASDAMEDYITSRATVDMSHTMFQVIAGGHVTPSGRCVRSADGYYARSPPAKASDKKLEGVDLNDATATGDKDVSSKDETNLGRWSVVESADGWRQEPGLNVLVIRADDFEPIYERTWDTSGGVRRAMDIEAALQSFIRAFFEGGEVDVARKSVPEHFLCISTCGPWSGGASKICEKVAKALQLVLVGILGAEQDDPEVGSNIQKCLAVPDKPLALAAMSYGSAKDEVHTWVSVSEAKTKATIQACLSHASGAWYPTLVQRGVGERCCDWSVPWKTYGREGWCVLDESSRVERYWRLIEDVRHMVFDAKAGTRVSVYNLVRSMVKYAGRRNGDIALTATINMLIAEIVLSRGALAAVECMNAGAIEHIIQRVLECVREDGVRERLDVLDKAYIKSLLKLLTVDNFALYAEGMRRGAAEASLRVIRVFWGGSSIFFDASARDMVSQLAEHMALSDLVTVTITAKSDNVISNITAIRSSLTCISSWNDSITGKVYVLDIEPSDGPDGLLELPKRCRKSDVSTSAMTQAQKILQAYDDIWGDEESPDKHADKEWTMIDSSEQKKSDGNLAEEPVMHTPQPLKSVSNDGGNDQIFDGIVILCAKENDWNTHVAMIRQAPRLVWRARERGARAVLFVWPKRSSTCIPVQPLLSSPNFDNVTAIPSFVIDADSVSRVLLLSDDFDFKIDVPKGGFIGTAESLANRIGDKLVEALMDRPPSIAQSGVPPVAGRFRGRFKHTEAERLLPTQTSATPGTPSPSTSEGFGMALIRKMTFTQTDQTKEETKEHSTSNNDEVHEKKTLQALQRLSEKIAAPPMDENSHLDAWRSSNLEGGVAHWTRAMRLVQALGDHGSSLLRSAYGIDQGDSRPIRVLSLDGGGMRGIGTLVMLERILKETNSWCVGDCFDLVVGTSTGGIIAAGAGLLRMTMDELNELYVKMGDEIFPRKADSYMTHLYNQTTKFYNRGREEARSFEVMLRKALKDEADKPLYTVTSHPRWYSSRFPPPHVCLVSHLVSRSPATTFLLRSYKNDGRGKSHLGHLPGEHRASLVDSVRATTAAPWFLEELRMRKEIGGTGGFLQDDKLDAEVRPGDSSESHTKQPTEEHHVHDVRSAPTNVDAEMRLIDGAIASNNPTAVAVFEARRLFSKSRPLCVVSLGTGAAVPNNRDARLSGLPGWLDNTIHASCDVNQVDATIRHLLGANDSYYRFQPTGDIFGCELNDTSEATAAELKSTAAAYMDSVEAQVRDVAARLRRETSRESFVSSSASDSDRTSPSASD